MGCVRAGRQAVDSRFPGMARKLLLGSIGPIFMLALISLDTLVVGGELDKSGVMGGHAGITHRDSLPSPLRRSRNITSAEFWEQAFQRDQARGALIFHKNIANRGNTLGDQDIKSYVLSNAVSGGSNYFTIVGVGTPHRYVFLDMDTASDVTWLQCADCSVCFKQRNAFYNPANSSTFEYAKYGSDVCKKLAVTLPNEYGYCTYAVRYADGSSSTGYFGTETLIMDAATGPGQVVLSNIPVGCGYVNRGDFIGVAGMLGLGKGGESFSSNVGSDSSPRRSVFSYCLPSRDRPQSTENSNLIFGDAAVPADAEDRVMYTPQLQTMVRPSLYYVQMTGISVNGKLLTNIPTSAFLIDENGDGGTVVDSGTVVSTLKPVAYTALRDAFHADLDTTNLKSVPGPLIFDTCYDSSDHPQPIMVPHVTLHFLGDADMELPPHNSLISIGNSTYCFAFAAEADGPSVLGNIQQQNFRIIYDNDLQQIGFYRSQC